MSNTLKSPWETYYAELTRLVDRDLQCVDPGERIRLSSEVPFYSDFLLEFLFFCSSTGGPVLSASFAFEDPDGVLRRNPVLILPVYPARFSLETNRVASSGRLVRLEPMLFLAAVVPSTHPVYPNDDFWPHGLECGYQGEPSLPAYLEKLLTHLSTGDYQIALNASAHNPL